FADDSGNITTVTSSTFRAIDSLIHSRDRIVRRIAIGKSVRHDQVNNIRWIESLNASFAGFTRFQFIRILDLLLPRGKYDGNQTRLCIRANVERKECVALVFNVLLIFKRNPWIL